jgi:hypothetical protein
VTETRGKLAVAAAQELTRGPPRPDGPSSPGSGRWRWAGTPPRLRPSPPSTQAPGRRELGRVRPTARRLGGAGRSARKDFPLGPKARGPARTASSSGRSTDDHAGLRAALREARPGPSSSAATPHRLPRRHHEPMKSTNRRSNARTRGSSAARTSPGPSRTRRAAARGSGARARALAVGTRENRPGADRHLNRDDLAEPRKLRLGEAARSRPATPWPPPTCRA